MSRLSRWMDRVLYPAYAGNWDNLAFRIAVLERLSPEMRLLDLGAGAGIVTHANFRGLVARACGVDPDERVLENPYLDDARIGTGESIPYPDDHFDIVISNNVFEHLEEPKKVFTEVARVLKPGGLFIGKTPNRWHYVPMIAACTPHWFHQLVNSWRGRAAEDTFPTHYRANTPAAVGRHGSSVGLELVQASLLEGRPEYLRMSAPTYLAGWIYERTVNLVPGLSRFRCVLIATLQKPIESSKETKKRLAA